MKKYIAPSALIVEIDINTAMLDTSMDRATGSDGDHGDSKMRVDFSHGFQPEDWKE